MTDIIENEKVYIYCITNKTNNKKYIGQSIDAQERWKDHISDAFRDYTDKKYCKKFAIQNAICKYGVDGFTWEIIQECNSLEESNIAETDYILKWNTLAPNGYNLNEGGNSHRPSQETKDKIREKLKIVGSFVGKKGADHPNFGRKLTDEHKQKVSKANAGDNCTIKKITSEIAVEIYNEYLNNEELSASDLTKKYNLKKVAILNILHKKSWKEALKDLPEINIKERTQGEGWKLSKLTEKQVIEILNKYKTKKCTITELSKEYNISTGGISNIINGKTWKHIPR